MTTARLGALLRHVRHAPARTGGVERTDGELLRAFLAGDDHTAFELLLRRHGPMVLHVCRSVLGNEADAEDAFQATFLVLARDASAIRKSESLASWLHGVAHRMGTNARRAAARRRAHESRATRTPPPDAALAAAWQELQAILVEEVERLPEAVRAAFVLCCLENKSGAEAARQLGIQEATVWKRLSRARETLRDRLVRRGVSPAAALIAVAVAADCARAVPPPLLAMTVKVAVQTATAPETFGGLVSPNVTTLMKGATTAMSFTKSKIVTALLLVGGIVAAAGVFAREAPTGTPAAPTAGPQPARSPEDPDGKDAPKGGAPNAKDAKDVAVKGRVLGPDGKAFAGAKLYLGSHPIHSNDMALPKKLTYPVRATSGADGKFEFRVATSEWEVGDSDDRRFKVLAVGEGHGCAWATVGPGAEELTLRLVKDAPVGGRVLDSDGKPVAGAKLTVEGVSDAKGGDRAAGWVGSLPGGPAVLTTDKGGRFELAGVGPGRAVALFLEGPAIASTRFSASGTEFEFRAAVSRPVRGVVRDKVTGKPLAGATVSLFSGFPSVEAVTDREGRYELLGLAKAAGYRLEATAAERHRYFHLLTQLVEDAPGLGAMTVNFELVPGQVTVSGTVIDKATGKRVVGAKVKYHPLFPNPTALKMDLASIPFTEATTDRDGKYVLAVMPGQGVLGVTAPKRDLYMPAWVTIQEAKDFFKAPLSGLGGIKDVLIVCHGGQTGSVLAQQDYHALALLEPGEQDKALVKDVALDRAVERKGRIVDADGRPLTGVTVWGLLPRLYEETLTGDEFTARGINPKAPPRTLVFLHRDKKLGFVLKQLPDEKAGPLTVTLQPCGSVSGRVVDRDGKALAGFRLDVSSKSFWGQVVGVTTDKDGRFRADGLVPGAEYTVWLPRQQGVLGGTPAIEAGKDKDLGEIKGER